MVALAGRGLWLQRACVCHKPPRVLAFPACTASQGNGLGLDRGGSGAAPGGLPALAFLANLLQAPLGGGRRVTAVLPSVLTSLLLSRNVFNN